MRGADAAPCERIRSRRFGRPGERVRTIERAASLFAPASKRQRRWAAAAFASGILRSSATAMSVSSRPSGQLPLIALLLATTACFAAQAQSFNCRFAHYTDEAAICQDPALGRLDNQLNSAYRDAMRRLPPPEQRRL